jgi:hypothetical protein
VKIVWWACWTSFPGCVDRLVWKGWVEQVRRESLEDFTAAARSWVLGEDAWDGIGWG